MPVWHKLTKELRESGDLLVIGITEEQHPDRCRLWAQWQGIDWPILWDPFNLTGSAAVPVVMAVDKNGVIQSTRLNPRKFEQQFVKEFMEMEFPAQILDRADSHPGVREKSCGAAVLLSTSKLLTQEQAMSRFLWYEKVHGKPMPKGEFDHAVKSMAEILTNPEDFFRSGVAYRLRYDSPHHQAEDFQSSIDHWMDALIANPAQYIWRRRIQQWGPRLDKPYPFYDWIAQAQVEVRDRGEKPLEVRVPLTGSEIAKAAKKISIAGDQGAHPDPKKKFPHDDKGFVAVETATALHTNVANGKLPEQGTALRVHVVLRPDSKREVHWGNDAGPTLIWISAPGNGTIEKNLFTLPMPKSASTSEVRSLDFELNLPHFKSDSSSSTAALKGTAFYYVCVGLSGECVYLAQDFEVPISAAN